MKGALLERLFSFSNIPHYYAANSFRQLGLYDLPPALWIAFLLFSAIRAEKNLRGLSPKIKGLEDLKFLIVFSLIWLGQIR